jgi:hypothetical protein
VTRLHWVATRVHALTVEPGSADSLRLDDVSGTQRLRAGLLVAGLAVGVCGTDKEIVRGDHGWPPPDRSRPINGHESLGRVLEAPSDRPRRMLKCLDRRKPSQRSTTPTSGCKSVAPPPREPRWRADQPRRRVSPGVVTGTANDNGINALGDRIDQLIVDKSLSAQERRPSARNTLLRH